MAKWTLPPTTDLIGDLMKEKGISIRQALATLTAYADERDFMDTMNDIYNVKGDTNDDV
mgnify:FL=1|jgi:hypothetical protein